MKNVVLLGSTGSIGTSTIKVAEDLPDQVRLLGLGAGSKLELSPAQARGARPGGGQRALGHLPMPRRQTSWFGPQTLAHGLGRTVPHHAQGRISDHHGRARLETSVLGHGPQDYD